MVIRFVDKTVNERTTCTVHYCDVLDLRRYFCNTDNVLFLHNNVLVVSVTYPNVGYQTMLPYLNSERSCFKGIVCLVC